MLVVAFYYRLIILNVCLNILIVFTTRKVLFNVFQNYKRKFCRRYTIFVCEYLMGSSLIKMFHWRINNRAINYKKQSSYDAETTAAEEEVFEEV